MKFTIIAIPEDEYEEDFILDINQKKLADKSFDDYCENGMFKKVFLYKHNKKIKSWSKYPYSEESSDYYDDNFYESEEY